MKKGLNGAFKTTRKSEDFGPKAGKNKPIFIVKRLSRGILFHNKTINPKISS
jgi:hypothetical protein